MTTTISETVSKKRGRPEKYSREWISTLRGIYPELRSERQIIAKAYEIEAVQALTVNDQLIAGVEKIIDGRDTYAATILEQCGRLAYTELIDADCIQTAAVWVSSQLESNKQFTARKAVALLRLFREEVALRYTMGFETTKDVARKLLPILVEDMEVVIHE